MARKKILIVDSSEKNRKQLCDILEDTYDIVQAEDGLNAINVLKKSQDQLSLIIMDVVLPVIDGISVLKAMNQTDIIKKIPVLVVGENSEDKTKATCFELGISDFIRKPYDEVIIKNRVNNTIELFSYKRVLEDKVKQQTDKLKIQNTMLENQAKILQEQSLELKRNNDNIIEILGTVVEYRNLESSEHINRVKGFTRILAEAAMRMYPEFGLTKREVNIITSASALHDIGKIVIPDNILLKPAKLTDQEFDYMKSHTTRGAEILANIHGVWDDEYSKYSSDICKYHHERYDGRGYPEGLSGEDIPLSAQFVSIADVYDALVSERVYKNSYSNEEAFNMIIMNECGVFNPLLMNCFKDVREQLEAFDAKTKHVEE